MNRFDNRASKTIANITSLAIADAAGERVASHTVTTMLADVPAPIMYLVRVALFTECLRRDRGGGD